MPRPLRSEHGTAPRYWSGCRCQPCKAGHAAYIREAQRAEREAALAGEPTYRPEPDRWRPLVHGTVDGYDRRCRCQPCVKAHRDISPRSHTRKPVFDMDEGQLPYRIPPGWALPAGFVEAWKGATA